MLDSRFRIVRAPPGLIWRALDGDQVVGAVSAVLRPNGRWFVHFDLCQDDSYQPLLAAVADNTASDLYTAADERNTDALVLSSGLALPSTAARASLPYQLTRRLTGCT